MDIKSECELDDLADKLVEKNNEYPDPKQWFA